MPGSNAGCYWLAGAVGVAAAALLYWSLFHDRARGRRRCPKCWYSMEGVGLKCPECGRACAGERGLLKTRRRWRAALTGLLLALYGGAAGLTPDVRENGWAHRLPSMALVYLYPWADPPRVTRGISSQNRPVLGELYFRLGYEPSGGLPMWVRTRLVERCVRLAGHSDAAIRRESITLISLCGEPARLCAAMLRRIAQADEDPRVRDWALYALASIGAADSESRELIEKTLTGASGETPHVGVIKRLPNSGEAAVAYVPLLAHLTEHGSLAVPTEAAWKLAMIGPPANGALPVLEQLLAGPSVGDGRFMFRVAAACIKGEYKSDAEAFGELLWDEDSKCRAFAAYMLYADVTIGRDVPVARMVDALAHPRADDDPFERSQLVETFYQLGSKAISAREVLKQVASDPATDPRVAQRAREAVERIDSER